MAALPRVKLQKPVLFEDRLFWLLSYPLCGMVWDCFLAKAYLASRHKLNLKKPPRNKAPRCLPHQQPPFCMHKTAEGSWEIPITEAGLVSAWGVGLGAASGEVGVEQGLGHWSERVGRGCAGLWWEVGRVTGGERRRQSAGQQLRCCPWGE